MPAPVWGVRNHTLWGLYPGHHENTIFLLNKSVCSHYTKGRQCLCIRDVEMKTITQGSLVSLWSSDVSCKG